MKSPSPGFKPIARLSRRSFFGRAAATGGVALVGSSLPATLSAQEESLPGLCDYPIPIPHINVPPPGGGHFYFPGPVSGAAVSTDPSGDHTATGRDPSVIFNFKGIVGVADFVRFTGTGTDLTTGATAPYVFNADMRFMDGVFVGTDQVPRRAAFVFI